MKKPTIVEIRQEIEWVEKVRRAADRKGVSFSAFIRLAVDYYINRYKRIIRQSLCQYNKRDDTGFSSLCCDILAVSWM